MFGRNRRRIEKLENKFEKLENALLNTKLLMAKGMTTEFKFMIEIDDKLKSLESKIETLTELLEDNEIFFDEDEAETTFENKANRWEV